MIPYIKVSGESKPLVNNWLLVVMELVVVEKGRKRTGVQAPFSLEIRDKEQFSQRGAPANTGYKFVAGMPLDLCCT